ncbi:AMP-binding protein, partial [bacterium]|nr:AMP-binding protein [bacterium]
MNLPNKVTNIGSYDERVKDFAWDIAKEELGWKNGDPLNVAYFCIDRHCERGLGDRTALIWENNAGEAFTYTFEQMRLYSNAIAKKLTEMGVKPGDRVAIFLDRVPQLYFAFFGILKIGAVAMPLFSAFRDESLEVRLFNSGANTIITSS